MASNLVKDMKLGFGIAAGFALFSIVLTIILVFATKALHET